MRNLLKIRSLRNLIRHLPKQNYCIYRGICSNLYIVSERRSAPLIQYSFSTLSPPHVTTPENSIAELQEEFPEPKKILYEVLNEAFLKDNSIDIKPSIITEQISPGCPESQWKVIVKMKWPQSFEVEGLAKRKADALNISFLFACQKLKELGILDFSNKPSFGQRKYSDEDINTAKGYLLNIYHKIWHRIGNKDVIPKFDKMHREGLYGNYWVTELLITYPEKKTFKASAFRSTTSEGLAALEALSWLQKEGIISQKLRLLNYTKCDEASLKAFHQTPYPISLPLTLQDKMQKVLSEIEELKSLLKCKEDTEFVNPVTESKSDQECSIIDIIMSKPYHKLSEEESRERNQLLYEKNKNMVYKFSSSLSDISKAKLLLPITQKREEILKLIDENQVVILSGDTGCGKSTQIPQFILDHYISNMKGSECNIVVTQPRRISAVALAERVAAERGEYVGDVVGHQIRFYKCLPEGNGAILYCTTGLLLRKLLRNPNLEGISHVIIDEVHERNKQIDFILILLKKILESNKNFKLLLMSASFNTNLFAQYFENSKVIHIPGKMYPVEEYFLDDLKKDIPNIQNVVSKDPVLDVDLIVDVIDYIHRKEPQGAILCFLPGWHEIRAVHNKLLDKEELSSNLMIHPTHSRIPPEQQKKIFLKPPEGLRKVILATNIAETSLTIDDVVYVVNSGLYKGTHLDLDIGIASLITQWITKANVRQRKGRAGRVKPGKCYHVFSWKTLMKMEEYPVPEILRIPLESVILDCKLYCHNVKAEEFLSKGLQPPATEAIKNGINELQNLDLLDENEDLTDLGSILVRFSTHPRLSVALVYAAFLRCLDPVLTICAILTLEKEPFLNTLDDKTEIQKIKELHDNHLCSDHLSLTNIYNTWNALCEEVAQQLYIKNNLLDDESLQRIKQLKQLFAEDIRSAEVLIGNEDSYGDSSSEATTTFDVPSVLAALTVAFFPNVVKILQGEITQEKLNKNSLVYSVINGQKAYIQKESVVSVEENLPSPWLIYFTALKSEARRKAMVSAVSSVPGICLILFAGKDISISSAQNKNLVTLTIDDYKHLQFTCTQKEAHLLLDFREYLHEIFQLYTRNIKINCEEREYMISCRNKLIPVLKELLGTPQVPFTKGQSYEFVNNELVSRELEM